MSESFRQIYHKAAREFFSRFPLNVGVAMAAQRETVSLHEIYVAPAVKDDQGEISDMAKPNLPGLEPDKAVCLLLRAAPGEGKSSCLSFLASRLLDEEGWPLPVLLPADSPLQSLRPNPFHEWLREAVAQVLRGKKASVPTVEQMPQEGPFCVLVDDFDARSRPDQETILQALTAFPHWSWVFTVTQDSTSLPNGFDNYTLLPLNQTQIHQFIDRWYRTVYANAPNAPDKQANASTTMMQALQDNPVLQKFCETRAHLYWAVNLHSFELVLPNDRATFYNKALEKLSLDEKKKRLLGRLAYQCFCDSQKATSIADVKKELIVKEMEEVDKYPSAPEKWYTRFFDFSNVANVKFRCEAWEYYFAADFLCANFITDLEKLWQAIWGKVGAQEETLRLLFANLNHYPQVIAKLVEYYLAAYAEQRDENLLLFLGYLLVDNIELDRDLKRQILDLIHSAFLLKPPSPQYRERLESLLKALSKKESALREILQVMKEDVWKKTAQRVRHKIGNIAQAMEGNLYNLQKNSSFTESQQEDLQWLTNSLTALGTLLTQLKELAQERHYSRQLCRINELVRECISSFTGTIPQIEFYAAPENPAILLDRWQFRDAILELLKNAHVHAPQAKVEVSILTSSDKIILKVRDHGPGVSPQNKFAIFEPFFSTHPNGSGIGLTYVEDIVEAHGGTIEEAGIAGEGACFVIELPIQERKNL